MGSELLAKSDMDISVKSITEIDRIVNEYLQQEPSEQNEQYVFEADGSRPVQIVKTILYMMSAVFLFLLLIGIGVYVFSTTYRPAALICLIMSNIALALDILLLVADVHGRRFADRYKKYYEAIENKNGINIRDISEFLSIPEDTIVSDLCKAVKLKLIPQGHFDSDDKLFMVSDGVYNGYEEILIRLNRE